MPRNVNVGGVMHLSKPAVNVGGIMHPDSNRYNNIGGVYRKAYSAGIRASFYAMGCSGSTGAGASISPTFNYSIDSNGFTFGFTVTRSKSGSGTSYFDFAPRISLVLDLSGVVANINTTDICLAVKHSNTASIGGSDTQNANPQLFLESGPDYGTSLVSKILAGDYTTQVFPVSSVTGYQNYSFSTLSLILLSQYYQARVQSNFTSHVSYHFADGDIALILNGVEVPIVFG